MRNRALLEGHLEDISWRVLEAYPDVVRELIRGRHGVYALYKRDRLYYVGLAADLRGRLKNHLRDRHKGAWDRFSVYLTIESHHLKELESLVLRILSPAGNRAGGRFARSEDLFRRVSKRIKDIDADRRALIMGGPVAERRRRTKARRGKGHSALAGFADRPIQLRATYRGKLYKARLRENGTIRLRGKVYGSPSGAARSIVRRPVDGWHFWRYRNQAGDWVVLSTIRG